MRLCRLAEPGSGPFLMQQKSNNDQRSDRRGDRSPDDGRRNLDDRRGDRSLDDGRYRRYMDGGTDRRERYMDGGTDRRERYMDGGTDRCLYDRRGDRYLDNNKRPSQRDEQGRNHNSTDNPNRTKTTNGAVDHKPNYKLSGALVKDQLSLGGVVLKYSEPPEARTPTVKYRLYVYKNGKEKCIRG
jgi:smad nuclear-interacting protein 1